jgi:hypothetical protein
MLTRTAQSPVTRTRTGVLRRRSRFSERMDGARDRQGIERDWGKDFWTALVPVWLNSKRSRLFLRV